MALIPLYSQDGTRKSDLTVTDKIFGVKISAALIHQALRTALANKRVNIAHVKTRGEVRGGGKKPWKQKGTGRARVGSTRSPIWVGGGVVFGPRADRNFALRLPKKMKRAAICMALTSKATEGKVFALENLELSAPKTSALAKIVKSFPETGDLLLVLDVKNENIERAAKNLAHVWVARPEAISLLEILNFRRIAFLAGALPKIEKLFRRS